jgi:hypothetical protein
VQIAVEFTGLNAGVRFGGLGVTGG